MRSFYSLSISLAAVAFFPGAPAWAQRGAEDRLLSHCVSESFDQTQCAVEIAGVEKTYSVDSAPDYLVKRLATGYHNLAYVTSPDNPQNQWAAKERDLFVKVRDSARSAERLYLSSVIAPTAETREACLRGVLALDPRSIVAGKELVDTLLMRKDLSSALLVWRAVHGMETARERSDDALGGIRIANLLAARGDLQTAHDVMTEVVTATSDMDSIARCYLFQAADLEHVPLDPANRAAVRRVTQLCRNVEHRDRGVAALIRGDKEKAVAELEEQIRENPASVLSGYRLRGCR